MNGNHFVVAVRDVDQIVWEMCNSVELQTLCTLGDEHSIGTLPVGWCMVQSSLAGGYESIGNEYDHMSEWQFPAVPAKFDPIASEEVESQHEVSEPKENFLGVIAYDVAVEIVKGVAEEVIKQIAEKWIEQAVERALRKIPGGYHYRQAGHANYKATKAAHTEAQKKLADAAKPKADKITGIVTISTRIKPKRLGFGVRLRQSMLYIPRGRPPLPVGEWKKRYEARKVERRKDPKRTRKDKRKPPEPPKTVWKRPPFVINVKDFVQDARKCQKPLFELEEVASSVIESSHAGQQ